MAYVTTCPQCDSAIELNRFERLCPVCDEVICPEGLGERRSYAGVPFVRNWITALRFSGGDFDKKTARLTQEFADACLRRGVPPAELFSLARDAYYRFLSNGTADGSFRSRGPRADEVTSAKDMELPSGMAESA
jgi:hypothetical protein